MYFRDPVPSEKIEKLENTLHLSTVEIDLSDLPADASSRAINAAIVDPRRWTWLHNQHAFRKALFVYKRGTQLEAEDKTGKWRKKAVAYKQAIKAGDPKYAPDKTHDSLVAFLFPELLDGLGRLP